jgi:antitoxin component HigA of HigAB toxin-antitoxin module
MENSKPTYIVTNDEQHAALIEKVGALMKKGEANTTPEEDAEIRAMGEALMAYEQSIYEIPEPSTLESILEQRMYDMRCENKNLAQTLGISQEELEMIMWGDQKADTSLLNVIREKFDISSDVISNYIQQL